MTETTSTPQHSPTKHTVAFYNVENLFDIFDDPYTDDDDFLPTSEKKWTAKRYKKKIRKLSYAISNIGVEETGTYPALVGVAEVENDLVLKDLLGAKHLKHLPYEFVHFDSKDERGIDVALLYDKTRFKPRASRVLDIHLFKDNGKRDYTRDILHVAGYLLDEYVHVFINHWPSRRDGEDKTEAKRLEASKVLLEGIAEVKQQHPEAKILVLGDFNDGPANTSIKNIVNAGFFNPMETLKSFDRGTLRHNYKWFLFDQILFTTNFFERDTEGLRYDNAYIFGGEFLKLFDGRFKGNPYRTYVGRKYKGGYSDHFPVYVTLRSKDQITNPK